MRVRGTLPAGLIALIAGIGLGACDEGGAAPAVTAAPQTESAPTTGGRSPQWGGGNPALGPAKRAAGNLKDDIERGQRKLADDIEQGNDLVPTP